ncbi:MAG: two-component sensor histidine kinase, partial [Pseudonocardiaceae bacterium]
GLGLSISLEDARLHGGWLQAWGEPGKGSTFRLTLPRSRGIELTSSPLPLGPEGPPVQDRPVPDEPVPDEPVPDEPVPDEPVPARPGGQ